MRVTLFGATGKTGRYLIDEALSRAWDVTVVARTQTEFAESRVRVVRGDLSDKKVLTESLRGADAVVSSLGPTRLRHPRGLPVTRATRALIEVMAELGIQRLVATSTGTARPDPGDGFDWKVWLPAKLIRLLMPSSYAEMVGLADAVRASALDWTLVRLAVLTNGKASRHLNVGLYGHTAHSLTVPRVSVARFMLDLAANREQVRQAPGVSAG